MSEANERLEHAERVKLAALVELQEVMKEPPVPI